MSKTWKSIIAVVIAALIITVLGCVLFITARNEVTNYSFDHTIQATNGETDTEVIVKDFELEENGYYSFNTGWTNEAGGMITGLKVADGEGKIVFACTADSCTAQSMRMRLEKGSYEATFRFLFSEEQLNAFMKEARIEITSEDGNTQLDDAPYEFVPSGTWKMNYFFQVEKHKEFANGKTFGVLCGFLIGILAVYFIMLFTKKGKDEKLKYDERQESVRGKGFKLGFFTIFGCNALICLLELLEISIPIQTAVLSFLCMLLGILVYISYCIWNDGYYALNENKNLILVLFGIIGAINLLIGVANIYRNGILEEGMLSFKSLNLFCGLMFVAVFIITFAKKVKDRKDEQE